jgi:hypothetical protein
MPEYRIPSDLIEDVVAALPQAKRRRETGRAGNYVICREMALGGWAADGGALTLGAARLDLGSLFTVQARNAGEVYFLEDTGSYTLQHETAGLAPAAALALGSTTAGRTWELAELRTQLAALFGPVAPQA